MSYGTLENFKNSIFLLKILFLMKKVNLICVKAAKICNTHSKYLLTLELIKKKFVEKYHRKLEAGLSRRKEELIASVIYHNNKNL